MSTVFASVAPSRCTDRLLGTEEPFGITRSGLVDQDAALAMIVYMISTSTNNSTTVIKLTDKKVVISHTYDVSHMLKSLPADTEPDTENYYGWLYTIEKNPDDEMHDGVQAILQTAYALCNTHRDICSREVAQMIAEKADDARRWEVENLRSALEYYATSQAWRGGELVSGYNNDIIGGQPWRPAYDALTGRRVTPLPEAVQQMIDRRRKVPEYLGRRSPTTV